MPCRSKSHLFFCKRVGDELQNAFDEVVNDASQPFSSLPQVGLGVCLQVQTGRTGPSFQTSSFVAAYARVEASMILAIGTFKPPCKSYICAFLLHFIAIGICETSVPLSRLLKLASLQCRFDQHRNLSLKIAICQAGDQPPATKHSSFRQRVSRSQRARSSLAG